MRRETAWTPKILPVRCLTGKIPANYLTGKKICAPRSERPLLIYIPDFVLLRSISTVSRQVPFSQPIRSRVPTMRNPAR